MILQVTGPLAADDRDAVGELCPIDRASTAVARRSTLLLLREASYGTARFDDFVRRTGLTASVTAARLRALVAEGLLTRHAYREPAQRQRHAYVLTDAGSDLIPILLALASWGDRHRPRSHRLGATHDGCGAPVAAALVCADGHVVDADAVVITMVRADPRAGGAAAPREEETT